ncbi:hypothetical protein [Chitinophaga sp. GbtcB8]|uniref:hypothetical protein n=1 Tax=Chitinophaga sp. GbtcB8 TaxID=2824753 RepID=UPI001C30E779|nr:hypothetical protein [Chitinophaga sp. GbtcB8]
MTHASYNIIRKALIAQRKRVASSPAEATKLINDLGIRDIIIKDGNDSHVSRVVKKVAPRKVAAR